MHTRDGVRLDADVYVPDAPGDFPVLLMRQPYGRAIASTVVYAHPRWYAAHGYIVVIQDVRGRGTSEGEFDLFAHEREDGYDSVQWAAQLPGSTGQVGMYGFSYQGMTQLYAAVTHPPALKTLCPAMVGLDLYADWAYENGAFCWQANLGWALQLSAETARRRGDEAAFGRLAAAAQTLPLGDAIPTRPGILAELDPTSFYWQWLQHDKPDAYWQTLSPEVEQAQVELPMLHIGGWFDIFLRGTLRLYHTMAARSPACQHLIVGPWAHLPWGRRVGCQDFGPTANTPCDRLQIRWFDQFLKGYDTGLLAEPAITLFEMGHDSTHPQPWRKLERWPTASTALYLQSTGLAALDDQDGHLTPAPSRTAIPDVLVHDPWRPVPALGGHAAVPSGVQERSPIDSRADVLTYTSDPLTQDLHLAGELTVYLHCTADAVSFDCSAVVSEVHPDGRVYPLSQGYIRVQPGSFTPPLRIPLQATCCCLKAGHALRLSLSGACYPAYPVNAGTGVDVGQSRRLDQHVITLVLSTESARPSWVELPVWFS
jgi:uncharacterized protein